MGNIRHAKVSAIPDGADSTQVRPSDWNAAHTLDLSSADLSDAQDGTWTPVLATSGNALQSVVYASQTGVWTRIGSLVQVQFRVFAQVIKGSASGYIRLNGLPFSSRAFVYTLGTMGLSYVLDTSPALEVAASVYGGRSYVETVLTRKTAAPFTSLDVAHLQDNVEWRFVGSVIYPPA